MSLADLIKGKKTAITLPPANANPAKVAKVDPVLAVFEPRLAGLATLALAESELTDILPKRQDSVSAYCNSYGGHCSVKVIGIYPDDCTRIKCEHYGRPPAAKRTPAATDTEPAAFEQTGDPVSCPYWYQVCWAVEMYQGQCTRDSRCRVYTFLKLNT